MKDSVARQVLRASRNQPKSLAEHILQSALDRFEEKRRLACNGAKENRDKNPEG